MDIGKIHQLEHVPTGRLVIKKATSRDCSLEDGGKVLVPRRMCLIMQFKHQQGHVLSAVVGLPFPLILYCIFHFGCN